MNNEKKPGFECTNDKGFHITFTNGITISVQFGGGNYCSNREQPIGSPSVPLPLSATAEIALWDTNGEWITKKAFRALNRKSHSDDVLGWVTPEEVARYISWAARQKVEA